jgi:hypothetical protein
VSAAIADGFEAWGKARDSLTEAMFFSTYGTEWLQALLGLRAAETSTSQRVERDLAREMATNQIATVLRDKMETGGLPEATVRALLYVRMPDGKADERGFAVLQQISSELPAAKRLGLARFKELVKEQFLILGLDEERAIASLPKLLPDDQRACEGALTVLRRVLEARGALSDESARRLAQIERLFGGPPAETRSAHQPEFAAS